MAFKIAGSMALKEACHRASPVLLEPIMKVEVVVPEEYMPQVFGDLNARRSAVLCTENRAGHNDIRVKVSISLIIGYIIACLHRQLVTQTYHHIFHHFTI